MKSTQFLLFAMICISLPAFAESEVTTAGATPSMAATNQPPNHFLTYEDAVKIALSDNWDLLALREQVQSQKDHASLAMAPNEPVLTYTKNDVPSSTLLDAANANERAAQTSYIVNWTLGFPGKALAISHSLEHQAKATEEQATAQELTIMTSLSNIYVSFAANQAFYTFLLEEQQKDKDLKQLLEKKYSASQAAKVDLLNAEVVTQNIALSLIENRNDYKVLVTQFRQILRRPDDKTLLPVIPEKVIIPNVGRSYDELLDLMNKHNHTVRASHHQVESSESLLTNAKLQYLPDFQLLGGTNEWTAQAAPNNSPNSVLHDYTIGVGISVPIFFWFNERKTVSAASHDLQAARNQYNSFQLQAQAQLETTYTSLMAAQQSLDASERLVVPAAKASFDLMMITYGYGKADYFMLNQARQAWHDARRDMITKRQNTAQLYSQLISQIGCDIQRTEGANACN